MFFCRCALENQYCRSYKQREKSDSYHSHIIIFHPPSRQPSNSRNIFMLQWTFIAPQIKFNDQWRCLYDAVKTIYCGCLFLLFPNASVDMHDKSFCLLFSRRFVSIGFFDGVQLCRHLTQNRVLNRLIFPKTEEKLNENGMKSFLFY